MHSKLKKNLNYKIQHFDHFIILYMFVNNNSYCKAFVNFDFYIKKLYLRKTKLIKINQYRFLRRRSTLHHRTILFSFGARCNFLLCSVANHVNNRLKKDFSIFFTITFRTLPCFAVSLQSALYNYRLI